MLVAAGRLCFGLPKPLGELGVEPVALVLQPGPRLFDFLLILPPLRCGLGFVVACDAGELLALGGQDSSILVEFGGPLVEPLRATLDLVFGGREFGGARFERLFVYAEFFFAFAQRFRFPSIFMNINL